MKRLLSPASRVATGLGTLALAVACGEPEDRPSDVSTMRVLAVRSETPFGSPGSSAELSMLAFDGSNRARLSETAQRPDATLWIGGCNNPAGDQYGGCLGYVREVVGRLGDEHLANTTVPPEAPEGTVGWGAKFQARVPTDIISTRKAAPGVVNPYGVQMVFFAKCGGVLRRVEDGEQGFPLGCYDPASGLRLGRDDFEYGFYPLFVYETLSNQNPELTEFDLAGKTSGPGCSDAEPCASGYHCGREGVCIPAVNRCAKADEDDCPSYRLHVKVPRSSVERAVLAHVAEADAQTEAVWVSYYSNAGSFEQDASVINDPQSGYAEQHDGKWRANVEANREVRLWAVVRDNRNGVAWAWQDVWVQ